MGYSFDPWILNRERLRSKAIFCAALAMLPCTPWLQKLFLKYFLSPFIRAAEKFFIDDRKSSRLVTFAPTLTLSLCGERRGRMFSENFGQHLAERGVFKTAGYLPAEK